MGVARRFRLRVEAGALAGIESRDLARCGVYHLDRGDEARLVAGAVQLHCDDGARGGATIGAEARRRPSKRLRPSRVPNHRRPRESRMIQLTALLLKPSAVV